MTDNQAEQPHIDESKATLDAAVAQILALKSEISSQVNAVKEDANYYKAQAESLRAEVGVLQQERDKLTSLLDEIKTYRQESEVSRNAIIVEAQAVSASKAQFDDAKLQAEASRNDLNARQNEMVAKISAIQTAYDQITQKQAVLFNDITDDQGKVIKAVVNQIHDANTEIKTLLDETRREKEGADGNIKDLIRTTRQQTEELRASTIGALTDLANAVSRDYDELKAISTNEVARLKASLESEIRALLPDAGSAGLAGSYAAAKARYAPVQFQYDASKNGGAIIPRGVALVRHAVSSYTAPILYYIMFLGPLLFIAYYFYDLFSTLTKDNTNISALIQTADSELGKMEIAAGVAKEQYHPNIDLWMFRIVVSLPLVAISIFGWSSIRLYRRLYEEYNHKQRVMELYHSFKEQIDQHGDPDLQKALLSVMLSTVGDKPSLAMHRYDAGIEDTLSKLGLGAALSNLLKGRAANEPA